MNWTGDGRARRRSNELDGPDRFGELVAPQRDAEDGAAQRRRARRRAVGSACTRRWSQRAQRARLHRGRARPGARVPAHEGADDVNFQPGQSTARARRSIDAFLADDRYVNQFESKISPGSLGPTAGSSRDGWEKTIFRGDYHTHPLIPEERPKYGSLNADESAAGGATQYGNSYLVLKDGVKNRLTLTPYDSSGAKAEQVGTAEHIEQRAGRPAPCPTTSSRSDRPGARAAPSRRGTGLRPTSRCRCTGRIDFTTDVARLVVNSMYRGNAAYETKLREFAEAARRRRSSGPTGRTSSTTRRCRSATAGTPSRRSHVTAVSAPGAPEGFTPGALRRHRRVRPAAKGAKAPEKPPQAATSRSQHPTAGTVLVPERLTKDGKLSRRDLVRGVAAPAPQPRRRCSARATPSPDGPSYGPVAVDGPSAPEGYTVVAADARHDASFAFVPGDDRRGGAEPSRRSGSRR